MLFRQKCFAQPFAGLALCQQRQRFFQILVLYAGIFRRAEQRTDSEVCGRRACVLRPADDRAVADGFAVLAVCQQRVERRGIGKGGVFADRRVFCVLMSV